jgi:IclR family transcriptional regulator, KDG regulon repressor
MAKNEKEHPYRVKSVARALSLLELLAENKDGIALTACSDSLGLHPSTAHRILNTMAEYDYVHQDSEKHYHLGLGALRLCASAEEHLHLKSVAMSHLERLAHETGELANLVVPRDGEVVYVAQAQGDRGQAVGMFARIGAHAPLHATGVGKCILAHYDEEELDRYIQETGLEAYTDYTITDSEQLREELVSVRERGYAIDNREYDVGVRCVSSPIRDRRGNIVAALSVSGSSGRVTTDRITELGDLVSAVAASVSQQLGFEGSKEAQVRT